MASVYQIAENALGELRSVVPHAATHVRTPSLSRARMCACRWVRVCHACTRATRVSGDYVLGAATCGRPLLCVLDRCARRNCCRRRYGGRGSPEHGADGFAHRRSRVRVRRVHSPRLFLPQAASKQPHRLRGGVVLLHRSVGRLWWRVGCVFHISGGRTVLVSTDNVVGWRGGGCVGCVATVAAPRRRASRNQ
eukprot:6480322-Prymnesium_polylepis.1